MGRRPSWGRVTVYSAYVNRLADGPGVEVEAFWTEGERALGRDFAAHVRGER